VMVTATIFGAVALVAAFALLVERRATLLRTAGLLVFGYVGAAVLISPIVVVMLTHGHTTPDHNTPLLAGSLLSWVTPDPAAALATTHDVTGAPGWYGGPGAFGIPLLVAVGAFAWSRRREPLARLAALCFAVPALLSLGPLLIVSTHVTHVGLPWALPGHLPGLHTLIPQRFPMYAFLAAGVIVAVWLSTAAGPLPRARWALAALAVASMVPWIGSVAWDTPAADPPFFADGGAAAHELEPSDRVLAIPIIGRSMRWQSRAKFAFALTGGGVGAFPDDLRNRPIFSTLIGGRLTPGYAGEIRRFVRERGVTAVVMQDAAATPAYRRLFGALGVTPRRVGGVLYYRLRPAPDTAAAGAGARGVPPRRGALKRSSGRSTT
ncbi:MAG TPA: hypothetical protein VGI54_00330, partial [Solirubrobacteraceae bacterium]